VQIPRADRNGRRSTRRYVPLGAIAIAALFAVASAAAEPSASLAAADRSSRTAVYRDAIGDAGDAPDIAQLRISPVRGGLAVDVKLAQPTQLGAYGWILFGVDTDRNPYTGGGRGDELLVLTNGEATTFARWVDSRFTTSFPHRDLNAALSSTDLTFVLSLADTGTSSFVWSVASLRQDADLAPGRGVAAYPLPLRRSNGRSPRENIKRLLLPFLLPPAAGAVAATFQKR
jgi:hypothetical protein